MTAKERYYHRKENGLCVKCGEVAEPGKVRCRECAEFSNWKQRVLYKDRDNTAKKAYMKAYNKTYKVSREKKAEYNRRYREKNPNCMYVNRERWLNWHGERVKLTDLSQRVGIPYHTLYKRLYGEGISITEAILRG